ncbi:MAG: hypothetical protein ACRCVG_01220 [Methanobacteriaceae archaeon]
MSKTQTMLHLERKTIYVVTASGGWSIIIMPDEVLLDNYHNKWGHIHPNPENHKEEIIIKHNTQNENLNIVANHIKTNKKIIKKELIKELKQ